MRKYTVLFILLFFAGQGAKAQSFSNENFIYSETPQKPVQSSSYNTLSKSDIQKSISYFDGLGRLKQSIALNGGGNKLDNNLLDWRNNWAPGSAAVPFFSENGQLVENLRINGVNPFGRTDLLWRCVNDAANDADGGWNTSLIPIDRTKPYQYALWVKRTGSQNGTTYHGTQNVVNLDGSANTNPYFWYGTLPVLDTWYLMVGLIQPSTYTGGYSGISGVYDTAGTKVISGTDFKWSPTTANSYFRSYLYYSTDVNASQYFYSPLVQKIDGSQASISGLTKGFESADIVTHSGYDDFDRQTREYLPYGAANTSGLIQPAPLTGLSGFYNTEKYEYTVNPFSEKTFEASPLNRVLKQAAPGESWKTQTASGHEVKLDYQTNTATEVKLFIAVSADNMTTLGLYQPSITQTANCGAGQLYKTVTKDENWVWGLDRTTEEFKDMEGHVILKRTYNNSDPHDTYYVYDQYGNLSYVLPPLANGAFDNTTLINLCYQYRYDHRNRLVEKKIPGKDWEYIVYDKLDRPILTQDANQRAGGKWMLAKYDAFDRYVYTGEYTNIASRKTLQDLAAVSVAPLNEVRQGITTIGDAMAFYSNVSFPNTGFNLNTVNYYDNYGFDLIGGPTPSAVVSYGITPQNVAKGLLAGSKTRVMDATNPNKWITSVVYYDAKGRPIYNYNYNDYLQVTGTAKTSLDFTGKTLETTSTHLRAGVTTTIVDAYSYDHAGRLLTQKQKINTQAEEIIASNTYDDLGRLAAKSVGGKTSRNRLQNIEYTYNIRGWLKGINDVSALGTDLFAFKISYDIPVAGSGGTGLFNGNISQTYWKTASIDTSLRNYNYTYDPLNRLSFASDNAGNYNENLTYDKNGNIKTLVRKGMNNTNPASPTFGTIDNLTYIYDAGNRLQIVSDLGEEAYGFKDDVTGTGVVDATVDYTYDANGNMETDANKGISTSISYNYLNLPTSITLPGGVIGYVYDANGVKQRKTVPGTTTDYASGFQYENGSLKFFPHAEGYAANNAGIFYYIYQYKDHLGNIRLSYGDADDDGSVSNLEIMEENNYYPFGLQHFGYNSVRALGKGNSTAQNYKYNGKELQDELGLNFYDYGKRNYDPAVGRFFNMDRFAEKYDENNPYHYTKNNPIYFVDIQGDSIKPVITSRFLRSMDPRKTREMHDFGQTRYKGATGVWNDKTNQVDITLNVQTSYSFLLNDAGFNKLNPFIKDDVQNHEGKHQEQIVEGFSAKITFKYGGKTYTGTVDEIATQMAKAGIEIPINDLINTASNNINKQHPPDKAEEDAQKVEKDKSKNPDAPVYMDYQTEEEKKSKK